MFVDLYAAAKIGPTASISFTGVAAATQLITSNWQPTLFVLRSTADCYVRQGGSTIAADTTSLLIQTDTYFPLVVEVEADSYLSVLASSAVGTLYYTRMSSI